MIACLVCAGAAASLRAQASPVAGEVRVDPAIDTVIVVSRNVFEPRGDTPRFVARLGNALHITTQPVVIRRLLLVDAGAPLDSARLVESERALRELGVFREVRIDTVRVADRLALRVETADGWSTSPQLNFSSSAGSVTWSAAFVERNFLGTATFVSVAYGRTPDRRSFDLQFASPGLIVRRAPLLVAFSDLSDGHVGAWSYGLPFYRTDARWSLVTAGEAGRHRVLDFRGGVLADSAERRTLRFELVGGVALRATSTSFLRAWVGAAWRREDFAPETTATFPRSTFGTVGAGIEAGKVRYGVFTRLNGFGRREDVDLSSTLLLGAWLAPRAWGYPADRAGIGPLLRGQIAARWPAGLALLRVRAHGAFTRVGLDSGLVQASLDLATTRLARQSVLLHVEAGALRDPRPGSAFDPWATQNGPRNFAAHAFTGTRLVYVVLEDRILVAEQLWGVLGVGLAPYVEYGGAWYAGQEPARRGGDIGLALRFGSPRSSRGNVGELAVGYRFGDGFTGSPWALTVRKSYILK
ncbi:MAG: hypothetical protein ACREMF_10030 [Gemmatimonadales bacterium]